MALRKHTDLSSPDPYSGERPRRQYCFVDFTLDLEGGFLRRGGEEVALRPKAFELLAYLVEHHGRLVTKTALIEAVWPDVAITDNSLVQGLLEIRRALADDSHQLIRTVARRGYVFTAPVTTPVALTRLIVLPFRILRHHDASDFLSVSLPDAITNSLTVIDSLVVRSTMTAMRFAASPEVDVKMISEQAQVDAILTGTILSDGEHLRVTTQLAQAPDGKLLWSNTSQATLRNIFQLQDDLVERIVQSLTLPLTAREHRALKHDVPASAIAYECYLRANQLAMADDLQSMTLASGLYQRCVDDDAAYAPAWACLGRIYRFLAKYGIDQADNFAGSDDAFQKAFRLNPDLALAHNFYTLLETDLGRSHSAMERLLKRAHAHRNDPNLFAGLVHACRYCGLLEASAAAHEHALRLDPHVRTSVPHTYTILGAHQKALESCGPTDMWIRPKAFLALGRKEEAIEQLRGLGSANPWIVFWRILLEGDRQKSLAALNRAQATFPVHTSDPEARFFQGCLLAKLNDAARALEFLSVALDEGYHCHYALIHEPYLEPLRSHPEFSELVNRAAALDRHARSVFLDNGGDRLLGVYLDGTIPPSASK